MKITQTIWLIMSKNRKLVAKGTPRDRHLIPLSDHISGKNKSRLLTYSTSGKAQGAIKSNEFYGFYEFYGSQEDRINKLESVEVTITMEFQ